VQSNYYYSTSTVPIRKEENSDPGGRQKPNAIMVDQTKVCGFSDCVIGEDVAF